MALPSSGTISISQISTELGRSSSATTSLGETASRNLAGVSSGAISMSNFYGKSAVTISLYSLNNSYESNFTSYPNTAMLQFASNGQWFFWSDTYVMDSGSWATPNTSGIGSNYWIRFTLTNSPSGNGVWSSSTGWEQLTSDQYIYVSIYSNAGGPLLDASYSIQIASDSSGNTIVASTFNPVSLVALGEGV
jgi:hypothetical protein